MKYCSNLWVTSVLEDTQRRRHYIILDDPNQSATTFYKVLALSFLTILLQDNPFYSASVEIKTAGDRPPSEDICI